MTCCPRRAHAGARRRGASGRCGEAGPSAGPNDWARGRPYRAGSRGRRRRAGYGRDPGGGERRAHTRGLTIGPAERLTEQVAEADCDEQCTAGILADLTFHVSLEITVAEPVGRLMHAARDGVLHLRLVIGDGNAAAVASHARKRAARVALTDLVRTLIEPICERRLEVAGLVLDLPELVLNGVFRLLGGRRRVGAHIRLRTARGIVQSARGRACPRHSCRTYR